MLWVSNIFSSCNIFKTGIIFFYIQYSKHAWNEFSVHVIRAYMLALSLFRLPNRNYWRYDIFLVRKRILLILGLVRIWSVFSLGPECIHISNVYIINIVRARCHLLGKICPLLYFNLMLSLVFLLQCLFDFDFKTNVQV